MKLRTTIGLLVAVCAVAALIKLLDEQSLQEKGAGGEDLLMPIDMESVTELVIEDEAIRVTCKKLGENWFMVSPIRCRADRGKIDYILSSMAKLTRQETITAEQRARRGFDLVDYGLVKPRARFALRHSLGQYTLLVGNDSPLGDQTYAKTATTTDVVAITNGMLGFVPSNVDALRDRLLFHESPDRVVRIEMRREGKGFVRLIRADGQWEMHEPIQVLADGARVNALLDELYAVRIKSFVWDPEDAGEDKPRVESYGLAPDEAMAQIQIWQEGQLEGRGLSIGTVDPAQSNVVHVKLSGLEFVYSVHSQDLGFLAVGVNDLRNRDMVRLRASDIAYVSMSKGEEELVLIKKNDGAWFVETPVRWDADQETVESLLHQLSQWQAKGFVDAPEATNFMAAFEDPYCVLSVKDKEPTVLDEAVNSEKEHPDDGRYEESIKLTIGEWESGAEYLPVQISGERGVCLISVDELRFPGDDPTNPLSYRRRSVLSIPPLAVKRISLEQDGKARTAIKNESGLWISESGTNRIDSKSIDDILVVVSNLRALRFEAQNPKEFAAFGLNPPVMTLTLGLSGEQGIQKTILFGFRSRTDGIYSMIQGQDIAFVLPTAVADLLTKSFVKTNL